MDIFSFVTLFGGLAFFLYGMKVMSDSLKKTAGGKLEKLLRKATANPFKGLTIGALITIAIQSSSAMTVMLVGFVNSGIIEVPQTIGVIFGSDIGTTLTAWILSLSGIDGNDNVVLQFLKPSCFALLVALIGIILIMVSKQQRNKDFGTMFIGFAILMQGMTMMSSSMAPLRDMPEFTNLLTAFNNPFLGVLAGMIVTGIIQSSAASIGILQSLSMTGQLSYGVAIPIIMGANIGTCMTAILSSIGVSRAAKRVTTIHVLIKLIGTCIWMLLFYGLNAIFNFSFLNNTIGVVGIAVCQEAAAQPPQYRGHARQRCFPRLRNGPFDRGCAGARGWRRRGFRDGRRHHVPPVPPVCGPPLPDPHTLHVHRRRILPFHNGGRMDFGGRGI